MRKAGTCLLLGLLGLMAAGCSDSPRSEQAAGTAQPGGHIGSIPGTLPTRLCSNNIYSGSNPANVVHTADDIVVGPLRFSTLRQASQPSQYAFNTPHGMAYGVKIPITVVGTPSRWVAVLVSGDRRQVKVSYNPASFLNGSPADPEQGSDRVALESAVACGLGRQSFVQYNGGFTWFHPSCATIQVFDQSGHLLGSKRIAFGVRHCS
jgi:hypothetical protein